MSFDSLPFLAFLAAALFLAGALRRVGLVLLVASIVFYSFAGLRDAGLIGGVLLVNYFFSLAVVRSKAALAAIIAVNIGVLIAFKYRGLLFGDLGTGDFFTSEILIPLGISFYIFQITAYQVDIWRGKSGVQTSFPKFALFVLFFPQLIAGPIVRSSQFMPQIDRLFSRRELHSGSPAFGLGLICLGCFKKVFLADSLAPQVDAIFAAGPSDAATAWLGAWLFSFQIYFDFSGYSDMAVGMARLFGIRLPFNFRQPYLSRSPQEFWRRWHVTLSSWIRDYLYIPLGGSRHGGAGRQAAVMLLVMALAGLWHGANWTFAIWGLAWGAFVVAARYMGPVFALKLPIGWALTLMITVLLWVFFRAPDFPFAVSYLKTMAGQGGMGGLSFIGDAQQAVSIGVGCALLFGLHWAERQLFGFRAGRVLLRWDGPVLWGVLAGLTAWMVVLPKLNANPFIYFRF